MKVLAFALYDFWKQKWLIGILMFELLVALVYGSFTIGLLATTLANRQGMNAVSEYRLVQISTDSYESFYSPDLHSLLERIFDQKEGYSVVAADDQNLLYAFGAFEDIFLSPYYTGEGAQRPAVQTPYCVAGSNVNLQESPAIVGGNFRELTIPTAGKLAKGAYCLVDIRKTNLDNSLVAVLSYGQYTNAFYETGVLENTFLVNPSGALLQEILQVAFAAGIRVEFRDLNDFVSSSYEGFIQGGAVYGLLLGLGLVFIMLHVVLCLGHIIEANMREYSIHLAYGGRFYHIFIRCFYVALTIVLPPVLLHAFVLSVTITESSVNKPLYLLAAVVVALLVCGFSLRKLVKRDIAMYFERVE